jgi:hypothetical protein
VPAAFLVNISMVNKEKNRDWDKIVKKMQMSVIQPAKRGRVALRKVR